MNVVASDLLPRRLELAKKFGARWIFRAHEDAGDPSTSQPLLPMNLPSPGLSSTLSPSQGERDGVRGSLVGSRAQCAIKVREGLSRTAAMGAHSLQTAIHRGFDAAIVTAPSDAAVRQAQQLVRGGGQVLLFAHTRRGGETPLDLSAVCVDEKDLIGSYSSDVTLQAEAVRLVFSRKLDVRKLITHRFPLEQTADAIQQAARPNAESLKIVVVPDLAK